MEQIHAHAQTRPSPKPARHWLNPYFAIMVALPMIVACYYLVQAVEWLRAVWVGNWGYFVVVGFVLLTPIWWRGYRAIYQHLEDRRDRSTYRELLQAVTVQARSGYNLEFSNQRTGEALKLTNPYSGRAHVQEIQEITAPAAPMIEGPKQTIPDVVRYNDVADQVPDDQSLLGIHPDTGELELTDWEKLKMLWVVGGSSTGKSNTVFGKALEAVEKGAKLLVVDQHAVKADSLARKLAPLSRAFLAPIAVKDAEVLATLQAFKAEFERRVNGGSCEQKIVLICDEMNRMVRNDALKKPLQEIVAICGEESRGFGMYGWFLSQKCAHLKWLRDSAITVIAHRLTTFAEAKLACNDDRKAANRLLAFKVGRTYIYGVDFDEPVELQQPLYEASGIIDAVVSEESDDLPDWEQETEELEDFPPSESEHEPPSLNRMGLHIVEGASEGATKWDLVPPLTEQEKKICRLFFDEGLNNAAILKEIYPDRRGGEAYQRAASEVAAAIRKYPKFLAGLDQAL